MMKIYIYLILFICVAQTPFFSQDDLSTKQRTINNTQEIERIDDQVDENEQNLSELKSEITLKSDETTVSNISETLNASLDTVKTDISSLESKLEDLRLENITLQDNYTNLSDNYNKLNILITNKSSKLQGEIDSISELSKNISNDLIFRGTQVDRLNETSDSLGISVIETRANTKSNLEKGEQNDMYIKIALSIIAILILLTIVIIRLTRKTKSQLDITTKDVSDIHELQKALESLLGKQNDLIQAGKKGGDKQDLLPLVKSLADDIAKLDNIICQMDPNARGLKNIIRAVRSQRTNLKVSTGYDVPNLIGEKVNTGDLIDIETEEIDESLPVGERIITRIIKPKILKDGAIIQRPKVETKTNHG
jgi:hypothetical protein